MNNPRNIKSKFVCKLITNHRKYLKLKYNEKSIKSLKLKNY